MSLKKEKDLENVNFGNQMLLNFGSKFFNVKDAQTDKGVLHGSLL